MATKWASLPASYSNKKKVERLDPDAAASLHRMSLRLVAGAGANFSIWSALRTKAEQIALFTANYTPTSRGRKLSTDRSYQGRIWARKAGGVSVASPDLGSNHQDGKAMDIHGTAIQSWIKANGLRFGWSWDEGKRVGENWHFRYIASNDQYRSEGTPKIQQMQKQLGLEQDSKVGTGFVAAVRAFQKANGLTVDGIAGPNTQAKILAGKGEAAPEAAPPTPTVPAVVTASPGWMPGVDTSQTWTGNSHKADVTKIVLHTTEGSGFVDYQGGKVAPHFTVHRDGTIRQHFPTTQSAKALEHPAGTVETNNGGVIQIEFIGSCDRAYATANGLFFTEDAQDVDLAGLASVLAWVSAAHGIPLTADGLAWPTTNAAYTSAPQRMGDSEWLAYAGVCGHTHVPHNSHWDPGAFPVARLLALAGGSAPAAPSTPTTPTTGGDMPTGKALLMALIAAPDFPLLRTNEHLCYYGPKTGPKESVSGHQANTLNPGDVGSSGSTGLKAWQKRMNARGYSLTVDGKYGDKTATAAKNLQKLAGITQDGLIGPDCWHAAYLLPVK